MMASFSKWLPSIPILDWGRRYNRETFINDAVAALIVTIMLIPQSLAYALLAGVPPEVGLYASVAPLLLYAVLGSSSVLAVGPVAVVSLMTAAAVGEHATAGTHAYWQIAITLAFLSGDVLTGASIMLAFGLGTLPNLLLISRFSAALTQFGQYRWVRYFAASLLFIGAGFGMYRAWTLPDALLKGGFCLS